MNPDVDKQWVVLMTGPSGTGRVTAMNALEASGDVSGYSIRRTVILIARQSRGAHALAPGADNPTGAHVARDPRFSPFLRRVVDLFEVVLSATEEEGKSQGTRGFGRTGGRLCLASVAGQVAGWLVQSGRRVSARHLELERLGVAGIGGLQA